MLRRQQRVSWLCLRCACERRNPGVAQTFKAGLLFTGVISHGSVDVAQDHLLHYIDSWAVGGMDMRIA